MTTQNIIKILPFPDQFKSKLLAEFNSLNPDQKFDTEQILWRGYRTLYRIKLAYNLQQAFYKASNNQEKLDKDFYKRVQEATEKEMLSESTQIIQETDLAAARKAMELIVKEIKASKKN